MAKVSKRRDRYVLDFRDQFGNRKWKTMPKGTTRKNADKHLREILQKIDAGVWLSPKDTPTFNEVGQMWLEYKKSNVRISTWKMYETYLRLHFNDLDYLKINGVTAQAIESFIAGKQADSMNLNTIKKLLTTLNQVLRYAARHRYIEYNPFSDVEKPKGKGAAKTDKTLHILKHDQISALLGAISNQKYKTLLQLAIFSGARQGELLGLKWSDVNFEKGQIHIQRTFNSRQWFDVKTISSNRRITIGPAMLRALKEWRLACPKTALNLVFPNDAGNPINSRNLVLRCFKPALKDADLPDMRFHDIRHTFASLLIDQNENPKYIQTQMGHSSITVTYDIYGHLLDKNDNEGANRMEQAVFGDT